MKPPLLFATCLVLALLNGCSKLTLQRYEQLHAGMTQAEVEDVIGTPASCDETLGVRLCQWGDAERNIKVSFVAGKAVLLSAHKLK
ncbi:hypothetical protein GCM10025771_12410 [Niveibacterium umoris]|uniref:DUF3862 domain-containing protein n=1 Tax=Niveibacterium umoris TaxID=1193620 RepID=A0A840BL77_9RHOO|nr:DUF3862 domain-containing protein [Niveibacterium umoris]MBB4013204.1 hypothetical protein [Niveibacterium umoris]